MGNLYTAEVVENAIVTRKHLVASKSDSIESAKRTATRRQMFRGTELLVVRIWENDGGFDVVARKVGKNWES